MKRAGGWVRPPSTNTPPSSAWARRPGIETGEATGYLDGPEYRTAHGLEPWVGGDNLRAGIGQTSYVTPLQLATYAMTIANKGVRYKTHLVHSVRSYDGTIESVVEPEILAKADLSEEAIQTVHEGMVKVVKSGTGARYFRGASYDLAAKTGHRRNRFQRKPPVRPQRVYRLRPGGKPGGRHRRHAGKRRVLGGQYRPEDPGRLFRGQIGGPRPHPSQCAPSLTGGFCTMHKNPSRIFSRPSAGKGLLATVFMLY